jgi:hypothetical protein
VAIQSLILPLERTLLKPLPLVEWKQELEDEESNASQFFIHSQFFIFPQGSLKFIHKPQIERLIFLSELKCVIV